MLVLVTVSAVLFEGLHLAGALVQFPLPAYGLPSLASLCGGILFGIGMVLAGGCVVGILYRLGAGARLSLWGLAGLIAGSALYAEIHPLWSTFAKTTTFAAAVTLPQWSGLPPWIFVLALVAVTGLTIWRYPAAFVPPVGWRAVAGYIPPVYAALALAGIGALSVVLLGVPMGVTTSYAKVAAVLEQALLSEHFAATEFFQGQTLDLTLPLAAQPLRGGPGPDFDGIAAIQYPLIIGIVLGAALSAWHLGEWHGHEGATRRQQFSVLCGGFLMGLASRMTPGCNVWHLWGGLPIFAGQSILFLLGILPGAWFGGRLLLRWVLPDDHQGGRR
ncbi:MAG: hypothetical protein A2005_01070 [Desulfuromonadales bacterium GWC2_61_20]|nr:MAG: hypothetical protein A2005_01070 [Desulfuromonadales bacterium GWC2_61_20]